MKAGEHTKGICVLVIVRRIKEVHAVSKEVEGIVGVNNCFAFSCCAAAVKIDSIFLTRIFVVGNTGQIHCHNVGIDVSVFVNGEICIGHFVCLCILVSNTVAEVRR